MTTQSILAAVYAVLTVLFLNLPLFAYDVPVRVGSLKSADECKVSLQKQEPLVNFYVVEGSQLKGQAAAKMATQLKAQGARTRVHVDVLNVPRYEVLTSQKVVDSAGNPNDPCVGVTSAVLTQICTAGSQVSACEVRCQLQWVGDDCR